MWWATTSCSSRAILARSPRAACSSRLPARDCSDARRAAASARERPVLPTMPATAVSVRMQGDVALAVARSSQRNHQQQGEGKQKQQPHPMGPMPGDQVADHDQRDGCRHGRDVSAGQRRRVRQRDRRSRDEQVGTDHRHRNGGQQREQEGDGRWTVADHPRLAAKDRLRRPTAHRSTSHLDQSEKREDDSGGHRQLGNTRQPPACIDGAAQERRSLAHVRHCPPTRGSMASPRGRALTSPSGVMTALTRHPPGGPQDGSVA